MVEDVDLDVSPGEILVVLGQSGCGKSTLLRAFAGLLRPLAGRIVADGAASTGPAAERALVFQDDALLPWRTAARATSSCRSRCTGVPRAGSGAAAPTSGSDGSGSPRYAERLPGQLSGGMRQRVQLARALAGAPGLICMDEPFGALDAQTRASMQQLLVETLARRPAARSSSSPTTWTRRCSSADRVVVLGRHGVVAEHRIERPRDPRGPRRPAQRAEILAALHRTQSLAPSAPTTHEEASAASTAPPSAIPAAVDRPRRELTCDVLVIGGGTAGTMAAITAAEARRRRAAAGEGARPPLRRARHGHGRRQQRRHPRQGRRPRTTSPRSPAPTTASSTRPPSARPPPAASTWCSGWSGTA